MSLEDLFPNLDENNYRVTSPCTEDYNCIAFAAGHEDARWEPFPHEDYYWPEGVPFNYSIEALCLLFEQIGYVRCGNDYSLEEGYEKVAIYREINCDEYSHAAKQLPDGSWTSKIGGFEDIWHGSLEVLCGAEYGTVHQILKRSM